MAPRPRRRVILVFGESNNDQEALIEIARAIKPRTSVAFEKRRRPLVLLRSTEKLKTRRDTAEDIAAQIKAASVMDEVVSIVVHRDCDEVEPAHIRVAKELRDELRRVHVTNVVTATPSFEIEAWWMLFPKAIAKTCGAWRSIDLGKKHVGYIPNAKEFLIKSLRPKDPSKKARVDDYRESDGIQIARNAREMGLLTEEICQRCSSLGEYWKSVTALPI